MILCTILVYDTRLAVYHVISYKIIAYTTSCYYTSIILCYMVLHDILYQYMLLD